MKKNFFCWCLGFHKFQKFYKSAFHKCKPPIYIANVNITIIKISNKVLFGEKGFKYFLGCKDDDDDKI